MRADISAWVGRIRVVASVVAVAGSAAACTGGGGASGASASGGSPAEVSPSVTSSGPAQSAPAKGKPVADDPCPASKGKYGGRIIKVFPAVGVEAGKPEYHGGGALQVWRSIRCGTVWAKMIRSPEETRGSATQGSAGIFVPDHAHATRDNETFSVSRWSYESPAFRLPAHASFEAAGGYLGKYQYEAGGKLHL